MTELSESLARQQSAPGSSVYTDTVLRGIQREYLQTPALCLTLGEAQRLWELEQTECEALLTALVDAGFLRRTRGGAFARSDSAR